MNRENNAARIVSISEVDLENAQPANLKTLQ